MSEADDDNASDSYAAPYRNSYKFSPFAPIVEDHIDEEAESFDKGIQRSAPTNRVPSPSPDYASAQMLSIA